MYPEAGKMDTSPRVMEVPEIGLELIVRPQADTAPPPPMPKPENGDVPETEEETVDTDSPTEAETEGESTEESTEEAGTLPGNRRGHRETCRNRRNPDGRSIRGRRCRRD